MKVVKIIGEKPSANCYLVVDDNTAILIDASVHVSTLEENLRLFGSRPNLKAILLTHEHFDHIDGLGELLNKYKCPAYISVRGKPSLYRVEENLSFKDTPFIIKEKKSIKTFKDEDVLEFGSIKVKCYLTPGHSRGSSCFTIEDNMFTGDTIFSNSVGRTDMNGGDPKIERISLMRIRDELSNGIKNFYPGHGANFDFDEMIYNLGIVLGE